MPSAPSRTICPADPRPCDEGCDRLCKRLLLAPINCLHFVGFKDDRWWNAVKTFGAPDIVHRKWDARAKAEIADGDIAIFADGDEYSPVTPYAWNDSERF